ncbi:Wzz/FepE/Etk N-terminal domain-containing protein [Methylobacterium oxalidis]|uniref:Wzz/FepE/Etk N-terminal domain-containing protein n=1 Tax=Methylobacterium oxalidis TaxID=944322 RepID=UPI0033147122
MNHHSPVIAAPEVGASLDIVRRRWRLVLSFGLLAALAAGIYLALAPPQFTSTALLMVEPRGSGSFSTQMGVNDSSMASARVESQVEIIRSEQIAQTVVEQLNLQDRLLEPGPARRLWRQGLEYLEGVAPWEEAKQWLERASSAPQRSDEERLTAATAALARHITVRRLSTTYTIEISATMPSAQEAALVTNTVAEAYMELQRQLGEDNARRSTNLLEASTTQLRVQARAAEKAVEDLKLSGIVNVADPAASKGKLRDLESAAIAYRNLFDRVLERSIETSQQQLASLPSAQVVSPGRVPHRKSGPNAILILAAALTLGLSLGTAAALYRG